ncbi:protein SSUH2 homolog isoform X2 [Engystomops pustulosus]|uniref:protein SSUH2 homolog isoform X2 n=1 Tax=Engystomops pustulosus TaxID=76066 RepID=UPI003AFAA71C
MEQSGSQEDVSDQCGEKCNPGFVEDEPDGYGNTCETFPSAPEENLSVQPATISEDDARQSFLEYAEKHCCYSSAPAQDMTIQNLQNFNTHRYSLVTFTESRTCAWKAEPYNGQEVDGPANGPAPSTWEVIVNRPDWFVTGQNRVRVPHTSVVEICSNCCGRGRVRCASCCGTGRGMCMGCCGSGRSGDRMCYSCGGIGRARCSWCSGTGLQLCFTCVGKGELLKYLRLKVKWENHNFNFIADHKSDFPNKRFKKVTGKIVFSDERQMVSPVTNFPETSINEASQNVIVQHRTEFQQCRILRQRHSIEWLPLTKVNYIWKSTEYDYYVYGNENKAYAKNYPRKCCCAVM